MSRNKKIIFIISLSLNLVFILLLAGGIGSKVYHSKWGEKKHPHQPHHQLTRQKMRDFKKTPLIKAEIVELKEKHQELYKILEHEPFDRLATTEKMDQINQNLNTIKGELIKFVVNLLEELPPKERVAFAKKFIKSAQFLRPPKKGGLKRGKRKHEQHDQNPNQDQ